MLVIKDEEGNPVDLSCLVCGEVIKPPPYVPANYEGDLVCQNPKCNSVLGIKLVNSQVAKYRIKADRREETARKESFGALSEGLNKALLTPRQKGNGEE